MKTVLTISVAWLILFLGSDRAMAQETGFEAWLQEFRAEAEVAGIRRDVLDLALSDVSVNQRVYDLNDNQPEFSRSIWDYLDTAVSVSRVENGRTKISQHDRLLSLVEQSYGVDAEIIVAIWGMESAYGEILGNHDVFSALATLAFQGRRTGYGRSQLIGALKILQNGFADRGDMKGSWAGAMGHTQFIPTTYLAYAIDHNLDGKRDIWSNLGDVFASTANYLSASGYRQNERWGIEVRLPSNFDYALAGTAEKLPLAEWASRGVTSMRGELMEQFDPNLRGRIIVPAGAKGPAFLVFKNFEAILDYNRSTAYALAVGLLANELAGRNASVVASWPREDKPLSLSERKQLQQALADLGYNPGPVDGIVGAGTRAALRRWQGQTGAPADGYASSRVLETLLESQR